MPIDLAIISNSYTPYRIALHRRIVNEMPQVKLHSIFTHDTSNAPWKTGAPDEINPIPFGPGELADLASSPKRALHEWRKGGRIIEYLKQHNIKAVVLLGYADAARIRILRYTHRHGVPTFLFGDSNIRGDVASGLKAFIKRQVVSRVVRQCTGVMPCGTLGQEYFEKYGAKREQVFFFPYEPDYNLIQSMPQSQIDAVKAKYNLKDGRRRIVFSGRLVDVKRPDLLIDAFLAIAAERSEWDLVMIGAGVLQESLRNKIPAALSGRVIWTGFLDNQADVSAIYRACDILVLPSSYEPWALVINEAVAAGLAVISSDVVGAAAELVREGENGYLFPANDLSTLIDRLRKATDLAIIDKMKKSSDGVLQSWRLRGDPVRGLWRALHYANVVST